MFFRNEIENTTCKDCDNAGLCSLEQIIICSKAQQEVAFLESLEDAGEWHTLSSDEDIPF